MARSNPLRIVSRPGLFLSLTRLDWFALHLATASVLLFAASMLMTRSNSNSVVTTLRKAEWLHPGFREMTVDTMLLVFLVLEVLLLVWLWLEFPRRRRAE